MITDKRIIELWNAASNAATSKLDWTYSEIIFATVRAVIAEHDAELRKQEPVGFGCFDPAGFLDQDLVGTEADCIFWRDSPDATNKWTVKALFTAPIPPTVQKITLNAIQLREAIEFVNPDVNDLDQLESEVTIVERDAFTDSEGEFNPAGLYCHLTEYPEEGCIHLTGDTLSSTARPEGEKK